MITHACMHIRTYARTYVICVHLCVYAHTYVRTHDFIWPLPHKHYITMSELCPTNYPVNSTLPCIKQLSSKEQTSAFKRFRNNCNKQLNIECAPNLDH